MQAAEDFNIKPSFLSGRRSLEKSVLPELTISPINCTCESRGIASVAPFDSTISTFLTFFSIKNFSTNRLYFVPIFRGCFLYLIKSDAISETIHSVPNKGLLSVPEKPKIGIISGEVSLEIPMIVGNTIPFHTKEIKASLYFSDVSDEDAYISLDVEHEKLAKSGMSNCIWDPDYPDVLRQGTWNLKIAAEDITVHPGAVELRVQATNFIGESEISILKLRD